MNIFSLLGSSTLKTTDADAVQTAAQQLQGNLLKFLTGSSHNGFGHDLLVALDILTALVCAMLCDSQNILLIAKIWLYDSPHLRVH
jgi:hypothetical protein